MDVDPTKSRSSLDRRFYTYVSIIAALPLRMLLAGTSAWMQFATWLTA